jgi:hypothetical protein
VVQINDYLYKIRITLPGKCGISVLMCTQYENWFAPEYSACKTVFLQRYTLPICHECLTDALESMYLTGDTV